jgi:hypothetical protein
VDTTRAPPALLPGTPKVPWKATGTPAIRRAMNENSRPERCARVFISCGQTKNSEELNTAEKIRERLEDLGFEPYIAVEEQTLLGLTENIFPRLRDSEYFIFVDFKREKLIQRGRAANSRNLPRRGSLFSHQELAVASFLKLPLLAFQEKGVKQDDGILRFLQANATPFTDRNTLPSVIADQVQERRWNPYSRNELSLVLKPGYIDAQPRDGIGEVRRFFYVRVRNLHHHKTATNCYVYVEEAMKLSAPSAEVPIATVESKWAGYMLPNAHILPRFDRPFDAFYIPHGQPTEARFPTFSDSTAFGPPPLRGAGQYKLSYSVVSDNFPIARASFTLTLSGKLEGATFVQNETAA